MPPPDLADRRVFAAPCPFLEGLQGLAAGVGVSGAIDFAEFGDDGFAVLPGHEIQRIADEMDDAGLNRDLRKDRLDRLREALQAIDDGDQDILGAASLQIVHDLEPELGALGRFDPEAENVLRSVRCDAEREIDGLVADQALVADLDPDGVEENQRIARFQRPVLPFGDRLQHRIGDRGNQVRRHLQPVELKQMALDLPNRHAARIHRHDLVVEAWKPPLIPLDQLRIERPLPIARNAHIDLRRFGQDGLLRIAVAAVLRPFCRFIVEMIVQLRVQNALRQRLLQLIEKPILRKHRSRVAPRQKFVQRVLLDRHSRAPSLRLWPRAQDS